MLTSSFGGKSNLKPCVLISTRYSTISSTLALSNKLSPSKPTQVVKIKQVSQQGCHSTADQRPHTYPYRTPTQATIRVYFNYQ